MVRYLIDGNNVIGARPDGWWRDRRAATRRLVEWLADWAAAGEAGGQVVTVVFDGRDVPVGPVPANLEVAFAGAGRSADDEIARRACADPEPGDLVVVTSDAGLAARLPPSATRVGAGSFRRSLGR